ncbi:MAG: alpha/beta hydrolase [Opitutaceae bacterium]|jgi:acetyl esterase/lipase|nr:alpha/beta hydrolase [Opitutaceae bacterium]
MNHSRLPAARPPRQALLPYLMLLALSVHPAVSRIRAQTPATPVPAPAPAAIYKAENGLPYHEGAATAKADDYQRARCQLNLHYPTNRPGYPTLIWLWGGGLTGGGTRNIPAQLRNKNLAIACAGYRLSPAATPDQILEDAAAATAWTLRHIAERGGDPKKIFLAGHSAGGWLAAMVGMDPRWLAPHGLAPSDLAGLIPVSGQASTHFLVKKIHGDTGPELRVMVDEYAPLWHAAQKKLPPVCLIVGDRNLEIKNRVEENALFATSLRNLGHAVEFYEIGGHDHIAVQNAAWTLIPGFIKRTLRN